MFFNAPPGDPTKGKHVVYLIAATMLGLLLSLLAHAGFELLYLNSAGTAVTFTAGGCALPVWFQAALWLGGAVGGFLLGRVWWRYVYVDRTWMKRYNPRPAISPSRFTAIAASIAFILVAAAVVFVFAYNTAYQRYFSGAGKPSLEWQPSYKDLRTH
jgi:hypothetical protein